MLGNIKTFVKYLPYLVIIGLVIALSVTQCQNQKHVSDIDVGELQRSVNAEKKRVIDLSNSEQSLKRKIIEDSVKSSRVVVALKIENKNLRLEVKKAKNVHVTEIIDQNPDLDKFVDLQDSLIANLDATVDTLELQKVRTWKSFNQILSVSDEKFKASQQINLHLESINSDLRKSVRKERNKKTFWKVATGIAVTGLIFNSLNH